MGSLLDFQSPSNSGSKFCFPNYLPCSYTSSSRPVHLLFSQYNSRGHFSTSRPLLIFWPLLWMPGFRHPWPSSEGPAQILVQVPCSLIQWAHNNFFLLLPLRALHSGKGDIHQSPLTGPTAIDYVTLRQITYPLCASVQRVIIIVPLFPRALLNMMWVNKVHGTVLDI